MARIVVYVTDDSLGADGLPQDIVLELRDYRRASVDGAGPDTPVVYEHGDAYVRHEIVRDLP